MMKNSLAPIVTFDGLSDPTLPAPMSIPRTRAEMPKSGWLDWLECHTRFKFESPFGKFTAYKSKKGYWAAQRRVSTKLRHEYLGSSSDLTYELLDQTARKMNMGNSAYWREKYPDPRAGRKIDIESHTGKYQTETETALQTWEQIIDVTKGKVYRLDNFDGQILLVDDLERLGYKVVNRRDPMNIYTLFPKSSE
jgi:hypothetical protein